MRARVMITYDASTFDEADDTAERIKALIEDAGIPATVSEATRAPDFDDILVFTDGGCSLKKGGLGAWAYLIRKGDQVVEASAAMAGTTNNRMEMLAVIRALATTPLNVPIVVTTDSEYVIKGATQWCRKWIKNDWKGYNGDPVANRDLWEELLGLMDPRKIRFEHVRGHTGHPENERCDEMCTAAIKAAFEEPSGIPIDARGTSQ